MFKKGITLIEVLITSGLIGVISTLLVYSLMYGLQSSDYSINRSSDAGNASLAINDMSKNILLAISLVDRITYQSIEYVSDNNTIILQLPAIDSQADIIPGSSDYVIYDYDISNKLLKEKIIPSDLSSREFALRNLLEKVQGITFSTNNTSKGQMILINLTISSGSGMGSSNYSLSRSVRLRNQVLN